MSLRYCLREPIPEIECAAQCLQRALHAHLVGERELAEGLFRQADDKVVREWLESVWAKATIYNKPSGLIQGFPCLPQHQRCRPRHPTDQTKRRVHERDGFYCRFCRIPVIRGSVRTAICSEYPDVVRWGSTNATQHAAFQCMWAQYDHILPHARGGSSDIENLYLTCAACNYGRGNYLLEEFGLSHPSVRDPRRGDWEGLEGFVDPDKSRDQLVCDSDTTLAASQSAKPFPSKPHFSHSGFAATPSHE